MYIVPGGTMQVIPKNSRAHLLKSARKFSGSGRSSGSWYLGNSGATTIFIPSKSSEFTEFLNRLQAYGYGEL